MVYVAIFCSTLLVSLLLTPLVREIACRMELVDRPDGHRKLHTESTALGGGFAVFLSTVMVLMVLFGLQGMWELPRFLKPADLGGLLLAGAAIVSVGLLDDSLGLRGRQKFLGQIVAASVLIGFGTVIQRIQIFQWTLDLGLLSLPFTLFWLVGAINSVNLLDGIDGLATVLGLILSGTTALIAAMTGHAEVAVIALVFTASLAGFLRYNFPPASIFLGDAGSMLIGLVVGTLAIQASLKGPGTVLLAAPLALWTIPIFDSGVAIVRRKLTGRSIYTIDRGHLHHRLAHRFGSRRALAGLAACCAFTSAAALLTVYRRSDLVALLSGVGLVAMFLVMRLFGHAELLLLAARCRSAGLSLFRISKTADHRAPSAWQSAVRLQGSHHWEQVWNDLTGQAEHFSLEQIHLDVNLPMIEEAYHASWQRPTNGAIQPVWRLEMPIVVSNQIVGSLRLVGQGDSPSAWRNLEQIMRHLEPLESHLLKLVGRGTQPADADETVSKRGRPAPAPKTVDQHPTALGLFTQRTEPTRDR